MDFKPNPNFDSLSPQTTKGDLIGRTTVGATRIAVGTDNNVLTADSTVDLGVKWASVTSLNTLDVKTLTGATTLTNQNDVVLVSGTTFAVNLYSASGNSGRYLRLIKTDGVLTAISVTGTGFKGITLCTENEELGLLCDGTTFWPMDRKVVTGATNVGGMTILAITTNPVKASVQTTDKCVWWRDGQFCHAYYEFNQAAGTGGSVGSGNYLFSLPGNISLDTSLVATSVTVNTITQNMTQIGIFNGSAGGAAQASVAYAVPYSATQFRLCGYFGGGANTVSSAGAWALTANLLAFGGWVKFPVAGWSP